MSIERTKEQIAGLDSRSDIGYVLTNEVGLPVFMGSDLKALADSHTRLLEAAKAFLDEEPCSIDHHGDCQERGGDPCRIVVLRSAIEEAE